MLLCLSVVLYCLAFFLIVSWMIKSCICIELIDCPLCINYVLCMGHEGAHELHTGMELARWVLFPLTHNAEPSPSVFNSHHIHFLSHQWLDTPLNIACQEGHLHIVRLLLQRGAMIETRDKVRQS